MPVANSLLAAPRPTMSMLRSTIIDAKGNVTNWERDNNNSNNSNKTASSAPAAAAPSAPAGSLTENRGVQTQADNSHDSAALSDNANRQSSSVNNRTVGTSGAGDAQATDSNRPASRADQPQSTQARASELPRTASPAPIVGLIGLLALAGAVTTRRLAASHR